jgi:hypothetical protein
MVFNGPRAGAVPGPTAVQEGRRGDGSHHAAPRLEAAAEVTNSPPGGAPRRPDGFPKELPSGHLSSLFLGFLSAPDGISKRTHAPGRRGGRGGAQRGTSVFCPPPRALRSLLCARRPAKRASPYGLFEEYPMAPSVVCLGRPQEGGLLSKRGNPPPCGPACSGPRRGQKLWALEGSMLRGG